MDNPNFFSSISGIGPAAQLASKNYEPEVIRKFAIHNPQLKIISLFKPR
jgi:hypothetical protein